MEVRTGELEGVLVFSTKVLADERGFFREIWNSDRYREYGLDEGFVQDNVSVSGRGVLRGLHYQHPGAQGKLVCVLEGSVFDVAVDIRVGSPTFGHWLGEELSASNGQQLFIPGSYAHGFVVTSERAVVAYKCTAPYRHSHEGCVRWDDPAIGIEWPVAVPRLSDKDRTAPFLDAVDRNRLPRWDGE